MAGNNDVQEEKFWLGIAGTAVTAGVVIGIDASKSGSRPTGPAQTITGTPLLGGGETGGSGIGQ